MIRRVRRAALVLGTLTALAAPALAQPAALAQPVTERMTSPTNWGNNPIEPEFPVLARVPELSPEAAREVCRQVLNYTRTEIPPWEISRTWIAAIFPLPSRPEPQALAARERCQEFRDEILVRFDPDRPPSPPVGAKGFVSTGGAIDLSKVTEIPAYPSPEEFQRQLEQPTTPATPRRGQPRS